MKMQLPKDVENFIQKESDKPEWVQPEVRPEPGKKSSSRLVGISFRMDQELREDLHKILEENKKSRTFPYTLTDLMNQIAYEYVQNQKK